MLIIALVAILRTVIKRTEQPDELNLEDKFRYSFDNDAEWSRTLLPYGQVIAFAPDNTITRSLASSFETIHSDVFPAGSNWKAFFATEDTLTDYVKSDDYPDARGRLAFAIVISTWDTVNHQYDYKIRMNSTDSPATGTKTNDFSIGVTNSYNNIYREKGFLDMQHFIDQTIRM